MNTEANTKKRPGAILHIRLLLQQKRVIDFDKSAINFNFLGIALNL